MTPHGYVNAATPSQQAAIHDPSGQTCPPGAKPRVTATLWEDEGSLCYQVEAKGVCVARREGELSGAIYVVVVEYGNVTNISL